MKSKIKKQHVLNKNIQFKGNFKAPLYFVLLLAVFIVTTVFITIYISTSGAKLSYLETQEQRLLKENRELSDLILEKSSLTSISDKSEELGYRKPGDVIYTSNESEVAKLP